MENLQTTTVDVNVGDRVVHCTLKERDYGDYIVFDVYEGEQYLFTLSKDGDVLFNEPEMNSEKEIMDPRALNEVVDQLRQKIGEIN
jgi:hypothetical protein